MQQKILNNCTSCKLRVQQDTREEVTQALSPSFKESRAEFRYRILEPKPVRGGGKVTVTYKQHSLEVGQVERQGSGGRWL